LKRLRRINPVFSVFVEDFLNGASKRVKVSSYMKRMRIPLDGLFVDVEVCHAAGESLEADAAV
jgi:hypothetical protein